VEPTGFDNHGFDHLGLSSGAGKAPKPKGLRTEKKGLSAKGWHPPAKSRSRYSALNREGLQRSSEKATGMRTETTDSVTTEDVLNALERYARESNESDRQTAAQLGVSRLTLNSWLRGVAPPQRCLLARLAGFLRRVGYL
jgi:transcriptional regulator with XRE-family HTH domain